jgi:alpha-glucosidase (family GH31 glycosyl hydrolase)
VASSFPPAQPNYTLARVEGYVHDPALPPPAGAVALKLYYSAAGRDHWTTSSPADEAAAAAAGYALVGAVGFALAAPPGGGNASAFHCTAPAGPQAATDWYLFAHGADYKRALADYVQLAGPVPIPRRHWLGVSWSKWNESNDAAGAVQQLDQLAAGGWPLDTYVWDMQWHARPGWGGYTWDEARYGNVTALLASIHSRGLAMGMNLHDADGVSADENPGRWPAFRDAMGLPAGAAAAPFDIANKTYADQLHAVMIAPLLAQGLDLCWTDFQQGVPGVASVAGLVPTALLNHHRFYSCRPADGMRGTLHSRYAGRGDHRHTSAFGGDVNESWESLRFMIDFTKTAANAPLCWWGHEMMRQGGGINDNSELFVRTNQFGSWSPIFTSWGNGGENVRAGGARASRPALSSSRN